MNRTIKGRRLSKLGLRNGQESRRTSQDSQEKTSL